jgi:hypothetical protein
MNIYQHIIKMSCPSGNPRLPGSHGSGKFLNQIKLPAAILSVAVVLATGCSSTGTGFSVRLISPIPTNQQASNSEDRDSDQPARSPAFSDLFGG